MNWNKDNKIYYGGDYNPDQWDREIWDEDMAHLKAMDANMITLPVFSWAKLQPSEDTFDFGWLDDVVALAQSKDILINMATPTAAQPAWVYWQVLEDDDLDHNYGFIRASFTDGSETYTITKSYHYFMQFTKFIRPGMRLVTVPDEQAIAAFDEQSRTLVTVLMNDRDTSRTLALTVDGPIKDIKAYETNEQVSMAPTVPAYEGNTVTLTLAPKSVTTLITEL